MTTRAEIVAEARTWLNTPFHHQARVKGVGCDCIGLPIGTYRALELVDPAFDIAGYSRVPDGTSIMAWCQANMVRVDREAMQPGDVVIIRYDRHPQHIGILADYRHGGLSIIHALERVVETRLMFSPAMHFVAAFQLPGVH